MTGIIYKATSPDGKVYIGQTTKKLAYRKGDHAYRAKKGDRRETFCIAVLELGGVNAFQWEQIDTFTTKEELTAKEKYWVNHYKADDPQYGYNIQGGGLGAKNTPETRRKISEALKGRKITEETRKKLSEAHKGKPSPRKGKKLSAEHCKNLSEAHKGNRNHAKIDVNLAKKIKADFSEGARLIDVQKKYGITKAIAFQIKSGKSWKDAESA
jgi:group I intron endonuclease